MEQMSVYFVMVLLCASYQNNLVSKTSVNVGL